MRQRGLTLIELLVVIAIIALLLAISFPSLQNTKQHAKTVACQSNIKELTTGLILYEIDNGRFPLGFKSDMTLPYGGYLGNFAYDRSGFWWINYISDYSKLNNNEKTVFECPSKKINNFPLEANILHGNYGVNQSICKSTFAIKNDWQEFVGRPLNSSQIKNPSQTILISDAGYSLINWRHVSEKDVGNLGIFTEETSYIPGLDINTKRMGKSLKSYQLEDALNGRHPLKTVNVGFVDGHVSRKKAEILMIKETYKGYKNLTPLWKP